MIVLSADIGGTSTRLQLTAYQNGKMTTLMHEQYASMNHPSLTDLIKQFIDNSDHQSADIHSACFAVAGPIIDGRVKFTNLPWFVEEHSLQEALGIRVVKLINDFQAIGYGIETLLNTDIETLQVGVNQLHAPRAIIGAGTGLGVALMYWNGTYYDVYPTEGGHVDFAPADEEQLALFDYLKSKLHRVSIERVASGIGIVNCYKFACDNPLYNETESAKMRYAMHQETDKAATIAKFAFEKQDPVALRAMDLFLRAYGAAAGNLALTTLPYGGLFVVGGIAPKILPHLKAGSFMRCYADKGRMSQMLGDIPVHVVLNTHVGLQGAALYATRLTT